jgi:hypothetical protein
MATDRVRQSPASASPRQTSGSWQQEATSLPSVPHPGTMRDPMRIAPPLPSHPGRMPGQDSAILQQGVQLGVRWEHRRAGAMEYLQIGDRRIELQVASDGTYLTHLTFASWDSVEELARAFILFHPDGQSLVRHGRPV